MKTVNFFALGSARTSRRTVRNGFFAVPSGSAAASRVGSIPVTASTATRKAISETAPDTATSRICEKGSRKWPASGAVIAKPAIIITQTMVAAAPRRSGATPVASSTSSEVPAAPAPMPTVRKESTASASPAAGCVAVSAVAAAAPKPPRHRAAIPPTIHGVRRPPTSEP
ncbi:hypothetical protein MPOCJGCO_2509 [Methylobacterium trifolii]|uniref:Uncharacterized protein n=1 Tax=Methylobacterium trifolii TaxID=1003092 RepID=A0ABQ4U214_9HYPH|nr:hypothetical protein MPOCJGCO_2509 [Methylobacterium trifolii]